MPLCFVSWSCEWGRRLAQAIAIWLERDLHIKAWTSEEITPGANWLQELQRRIESCHAAIVCVTPEALRSSWVNYEVGALSAFMRARNASGGQQDSADNAQWLFPLLFGVEASRLEGPLASVQSTDAFDERGVRRLASLLRKANGADARLAHDPWLQFRQLERKVPRLTLAEAHPKFDSLFRRKTFEEPVAECVAGRWLDRYDGGRATWNELRANEDIVARCCRPYVAAGYRHLIIEVDKYLMSTSTLIGRTAMPPDEKQGTVALEPPGLLVACERGRKTIKRLVAKLLDPIGPVFEEAFCFQVADSPGERANLITNRRLNVEALVRGGLGVRAGVLEKPAWLSAKPECVTFDWIRDQLADTEVPSLPGDAGATGREVDACGHGWLATRPTVEERWRRSAWPYDRAMFAIFLTRRIQLAAQRSLEIDTWTVQSVIDQLCLEIEDTCAVCDPFEDHQPGLVALDHALQTLRVLVLLGNPDSLTTAVQRERLRVATKAAQNILARSHPSVEHNLADTFAIIEQRLLCLDDPASPSTAGSQAAPRDSRLLPPRKGRRFADGVR